MTERLSRAIMALTSCLLDDDRGEWFDAMRAELDVAVADGHGVSFALGCLRGACHDLLARERGRLTLTSYALALGIMLPMATLQIGCALFGWSFLFPGAGGLAGALLEGGSHEPLIRVTYQAAVPSLSCVLLLLGAAHVRIAWAMLDRDWHRVMRTAILALAAVVTLNGLMAVLFLDNRQTLLQASVLLVELVTVWLVARSHVNPARDADMPG